VIGAAIATVVDLHKEDQEGMVETTAGEEDHQEEVMSVMKLPKEEKYLLGT